MSDVEKRIETIIKKQKTSDRKFFEIIYFLSFGLCVNGFASKT